MNFKVNSVVLIVCFALFQQLSANMKLRIPDQFDYKVRVNGVDFGCFGFRDPSLNKYHTTFYVVDKIGKRTVQPLKTIEVHYPDDAGLDGQIEQLPWSDLKFLPKECQTDAILQQWSG